MTIRSLRPPVLVLLAALLAPGASAQVPAWTAGAGAVFESYSFGDAAAAGLDGVTLITVPFAVELRPATWLVVDASGAFASGTLTRTDGSEATLSGPTDTAVRLSLPFGQDRVTLAATVLVPTGKSTYTPEEAEVAGIIAADLLPFRVTNWGSGGALDVSTAVAVPLGALNVGARVGYQMGREFDLLEGEEIAYQPGDQLYVRVGADGSVGDGRAAAQVTVQRFGDDRVNAQNLYQSGNRIQGHASYQFPAGRRGSAVAYVGGLHREDGVFLDGSGETPAQTLFFLGGGLRQPFRYGIMTPTVDLRLLRSDDGVGQGYVTGVGTSLELPLGEGALVFLPTARVRFGHLQVQSGTESGITGFELGASLRFGGVRR
jgi:hypothetical protein